MYTEHPFLWGIYLGLGMAIAGDLYDLVKKHIKSKITKK